MKYFASLFLGLLILPVAAFAAYNDATFTSDTDIIVGGITLKMHGSDSVLESLTVNDSNVVVTLQPNSVLSVYAPSFNRIDVDDTAGSTNTCNATISKLVIENTGGPVMTRTITPSAVLCGDAGSSQTTSVSSGGGGGGGGGTGVYVPPVTSPSPSPSVANCPPGFVCTVATGNNGGAASGIRLFTRELSTGKTDGDVSYLQKFLNRHGFAVSASGAGSPGNETDYFGNATKAALAKYQASAGIYNTGYFGPLTMNAVNKIILAEAGSNAFAQQPTQVAIPTAAMGKFTFVNDLEQGMTNPDVNMLQKYLNANGYLIASSGPGSPGNESDYFGSLTKAAVIKFQGAKALPTTGYVGPLTRAELNK